MDPLLTDHCIISETLKCPVDLTRSYEKVFVTNHYHSGQKIIEVFV